MDGAKEEERDGDGDESRDDGFVTLARIARPIVMVSHRDPLIAQCCRDGGEDHTVTAKKVRKTNERRSNELDLPCTDRRDTTATQISSSRTDGAKEQMELENPRWKRKAINDWRRMVFIILSKVARIVVLSTTIDEYCLRR